MNIIDIYYQNGYQYRFIPHNTKAVQSAYACKHSSARGVKAVVTKTHNKAKKKEDYYIVVDTRISRRTQLKQKKVEQSRKEKKARNYNQPPPDSDILTCLVRLEGKNAQTYKIEGTTISIFILDCCCTH